MMPAGIAVLPRGRELPFAAYALRFFAGHNRDAAIIRVRIATIAPSERPIEIGIRSLASILRPVNKRIAASPGRRKRKRGSRSASAK